MTFKIIQGRRPRVCSPVLTTWQISVDISKTVQDRDLHVLPMEDYRKSYMAYQMAQTPVTLNDLEGHFSYLTLFNLLFGK